MTTIFTLKNASFNNSKLPNIQPFVAIESLEFAYNFAERDSRLKDFVSGNQAVAYRNDIKAGIIRQQDPTVLKSTDDKLGIKVEMGYLKLSSNLQLSLSNEFTIMVAGGYSGDTFPSDKVSASAPYISMIIDFGSGVGLNGFSVRYQQNKLGAAIKSSSINLGKSVSPPSQKSVMFITYKTGVWTFYNKTTNEIATTTNADLGLDSTLPVSTFDTDGVSIGHAHKSATTGALTPTVYAAAKWSKALSYQEIEAQYNILKSSIPYL